MTRMRCWTNIGLCSLAMASVAAMAQDAQNGDAKWGAHLDLEAKPGSKRSLGEMDLFLPIAQNAHTLVFGNLRGRTDSNEGREGNIGLGARHMLESGWNLGAYGYYDRRRSPDTGFHYNQMTLGAEALGRDWDFRTNAYLPQGSRVREIGASSGVTSAALSGASVVVTTSAGITREERALQGYDAEFGWRAPVFDSEAARQLRFYVGGYHFADNVARVEGPRIRVELAMEDLTWFGRGTALFLGAEAQHDSARGDQSFLSVRLRIPLGKESERSNRLLTAQERRMAAPVIRDVDIVTRSRSFVTTPEVVEVATTTAGGQTITVINSASTSGANLPAAVAAAGASSTVILTGNFNTTASINLQNGQTLMGAGALTVSTPSGRTATLTAPGATLAGTTPAGSAWMLNLANNSTVSGMTLNLSNTSGTGALGIFANGITGATIANNTISVSETGGNTAGGVAIVLGANVTLRNNNIAATSTPANTAYGLFVNGASATVTGNTFGTAGAIGANARYVELATANIAVNSTGNTAGAGICRVSAPGSGSTIGFTNVGNCGP